MTQGGNHMSCRLEDAAIIGIALHVERGGNAEAVVRENLRLQAAVDELSARASSDSWIKLANEVESLREQKEALEQALRDATEALAAISGTLEIYRSHQK